MTATDLHREVERLRAENERMITVVSSFHPSQLKLLTGERVHKYDQSTMITAIKSLPGMSETSYESQRKLFPFPSVRTVQRWVSGIEDEDGINHVVLGAMAKSNLNHCDCNGSLILDETAIKSGLRMDHSEWFVSLVPSCGLKLQVRDESRARVARQTNECGPHDAA